MENITDKELLAICNLSNLKMEFANLIEKEETKTIEKNGKKETVKIYTNHTIYSLLNAETSSIKNKKKETRVFYKEVLENDKNKDRRGVKTPIYENIIDLKKKAGIVYEYCEKYSFDINNKMHPGSFTDEWEILYAGDTYKIIAEYYDLYQKYLTKALVSEDDEKKIYLIKKEVEKNFDENQDKNQNENEIKDKENAQKLGGIIESEKEKAEQSKEEKTEQLKFKEGDIVKLIYNKKEKTLEEVKEITEKDIEYFEENYKNIENMRFYPTRDEIEADKEKQENLDKVLVMIDIASVVIPAIGGAVLKGARAARITKNHSAFIYIYNLLKKNIITSIGNPLNNLITNLTESYLTASSSKLIKNFLESKDARSFLGDVIEGIFKDYKSNIMSLTKVNIIGSLFFTLPFFAYTELSNLVNKIKENLESCTLKTEERNEAQKKLEELESYFNEMIIDFADSLKITQQGFGIVVLKNKLKKELVVCFKNPDANSDTYNNIKNKSIKNEIMMMRIIDEYLLYKICENANIQRQEYKTILTGFEYGADLADMYYYINQNSELPYEIKTFKAPYNNLALYFSEHSLANLASHFGVTVQNPVIYFFKGLNYVTPGNITFLLLSFFFRISGGAFYLTGCFFYKLLIFIDALKQHEINNAMKTLYKKTCEYGFIDCQYYSECKSQKFNECKVIKLDDGKYYPTIKEEFPSLDGEVDLPLNLLNNPNLEEFNIEPEKELQENLFAKVEGIYIDERTTEIFTTIKINQQDFLMLLTDLKISGFSKNFKFNGINEQGEKEFIETEFQKNSNIKEICADFELPLKDKKDSKLVELHKNYKEKKFDFLKKVEINQYFYKIFITENGNGRLEKYLRRKVKYVSYTYNETKPDKIQYSYYTPTSSSVSTYVPISKDEYIIKDEDKKIENEIEQLKGYLTFTRDLKKSIEKDINNNNYTYNAGVVTYSNRLYKNEDILLIPENFLYNFWIYIQDDGNIELLGEKELKKYTLNVSINKQYIRSFFRSAMAKIFTVPLTGEPNKNAGRQVLKDCYFPQEPKFYTEEGESSFSEMLDSHLIATYANDKDKWDEDELVCRTFVARFDAKSKAQLNKEFVELLKANIGKLRQNTIKEQEDTSDYKVRYGLSLHNQPNFNYLDRMISLLEDDPSILEKFYKINKIKLNDLKIFELVIGHFFELESAGEKEYKYNKKAIEYIYNDDEIKRGFLRLKAYMPNYSEESFEIETDKYILVEGAKLNCTEASIGEMSPAKNIIKINGKKVATLTDNKTGEQIKTFGYCKKKRGMCGGECINWEKESKLVYLGQKILTTESKGTCSVYGGKISVVTNGTKKSIKVN